MGYLFENETCSRCHGTGEYSYCAYYGKTCFKCHGSKVVLTKRGAAAQRFLDQLQTVSIKDLKVGALIECTGVTNGNGLFRYKAPVVSIGPSDQVKHVSSSTNGVPNPTVEYMLIKTEHPKFGAGGLNTPDNTTVRIWQNTKENIAKALEYQANLTKTGTPRKTAKVLSK